MTAIIDGSTYFRYIFTVAFPLMKPIIATVFILKMIGAWNDTVTPYLFLIKPEFRTLSTGLFLFRGQYAIIGQSYQQQFSLSISNGLLYIRSKIYYRRDYRRCLKGDNI